MYDCGKQLVYGIHGICAITEIEEKVIDRKTVSYYVLVPLAQPGAKYYIPVHNHVALTKLRELLTPVEVKALLESSAPDESLWIPEENRRKLRYRELIGNCDPVSMYHMVRLLQNHRDEQLAQGRKFHICDAVFLKDAKALLVSEFSYVLGIHKDAVMDMF